MFRFSAHQYNGCILIREVMYSVYGVKNMSCQMPTIVGQCLYLLCNYNYTLIAINQTEHIDYNTYLVNTVYHRSHTILSVTLPGKK